MKPTTVRLSVWILFLLLALAPISAWAEDESAGEATSEPTEEWYIWYPSEEDGCRMTVAPDAVGGSSENPISDISVAQLIQDSRFEDTRRDCVWVEVTGYVMPTAYYHYQAVLYGNLIEAFYDAYGANSRSASLLWVENFVGDRILVQDISGADIRVVGLFYDLCRRTAELQDETGEQYLFTFGPCHYGESFALREVQLAEVLTEPHRILLGELNQSVLHSAEEAPPDWPHREEVMAQYRDWLATLRAGRVAYWEHLYRDVEGGTEPMRAYIADDDNWGAYITDPDRSPILRRWDRLANAEVKIFLYDPWPETEEDTTIAAVCGCLEEDCTGQWPAVPLDAFQAPGHTACVAVLRSRERPEVWEW